MKDTINKPVLTQQEVELVVEQYIFEKTGKKVKIYIDFIDPFWYQLQMERLYDAFGYAYCYFSEL